MKKIWLVLTILCLTLTAFAQSPEKRYHSRMTQDGMLFFVNPFRLNQVNGILRFEYDMTFLTWNDKATVNFKFESNSMLEPDNILISSGNTSIRCSKASVLYIDLKKNHYEIRITSEFDVNEIEEVFSSPLAPTFEFMQGENECKASYSPRVWSKERIILDSIFKIYNYSRII